MPREAQGAVRVARLERTLEEFNKEMGIKVAQSLNNYHRDFVEPRLARLERLAMPFWKRWWLDLKAWAMLTWVSLSSRVIPLDELAGEEPPYEEDAESEAPQ